MDNVISINDENDNMVVLIPVVPISMDPTPVDPTPINSTPVDPVSVDPTPVVPVPVVPTLDIYKAHNKGHENLENVRGQKRKIDNFAFINEGDLEAIQQKRKITDDGFSSFSNQDNDTTDSKNDINPNDNKDQNVIVDLSYDDFERLRLWFINHISTTLDFDCDIIQKSIMKCCRQLTGWVKNAKKKISKKISEICFSENSENEKKKVCEIPIEIVPDNDEDMNIVDNDDRKNYYTDNNNNNDDSNTNNNINNTNHKDVNNKQKSVDMQLFEEDFHHSYMKNSDYIRMIMKYYVKYDLYEYKENIRNNVNENKPSRYLCIYIYICVSLHMYTCVHVYVHIYVQICIIFMSIKI